MLPILFALGPFELRTLSVFLIIGFLVSAFIFWRTGREEHYSETELLDAFLVSTFSGAVVGRVAYIILNSSQFGFNIFRWFDVISVPGLQGTLAWAGATLTMFRFAQRKKWDAFEVLDFWSLASAGGMVILNLGFFFDGTQYGYPTSLPWGVRFPTVLEPHHPVQIYLLIFFVCLYFFLRRPAFRSNRKHFAVVKRAT